MMDLEYSLKEGIGIGIGIGIDIDIRWGNGSWDDVESGVLFLSPVTTCIGGQLASTLRQKSMGKMLNEIPLLQDRAGSQTWQYWFKTAGIIFKQRHTNHVILDPSIRLQAVIDVQGIALYDTLAPTEFDDNRLVPLTDVSLNHYGYYLVYPKYTLSNPTAQAFRQWILPT